LPTIEAEAMRGAETIRFSGVYLRVISFRLPRRKNEIWSFNVCAVSYLAGYKLSPGVRHD
jgi:hypothetical protein